VQETDFSAIHQELRKKGVTLQLLWMEYKEQNPQGYQYSRFCELYQQWKKTIDPVLRQPYKAGEKMFVDYAGSTMTVVEPGTGEKMPSYVFMAVLGASNYTYIEASLTMDLYAWISAHCLALECTSSYNASGAQGIQDGLHLQEKCSAADYLGL